MTELAEALALFGKRRSGELARTIAELGRAALDGFAPPAPRKNIDFHRAWKELAALPAHRTWCLDTLIERLPKMLDGKEYAFGDKAEALAERLRVLAELDPDPRIARAMLDQLELRSPVIGFVDIIDLIVLVLERHADDETAPALRELDERLVARLRVPAVTPLTAAERARWIKVKPAPKHDVRELWEAVYAAPDDDAPRAVLADHLQEAGDPRGELIALQLREHRGEGTDELRARAQALVKQHGKAWLGPLRPITYRAELRRGFLHRLELAGAWSTAKWKELATERSLATVEELEAGQATGKIVAQLLAGPVLPGAVRALEVLDDDVMKVLEATKLPRLRELRCFAWKRTKYEQRFPLRVLPYLERTETVTSVGCQLAVVPRFSKALKARLVGFHCRDDLADAVTLWHELPRLRSLVCDWPDPVELVRAGTRELARVHAHGFGVGLPDLARLPRSIQTVEVIGNATAARELAAKFPKLDIVTKLPPSGAITGVK